MKSWKLPGEILTGMLQVPGMAFQQTIENRGFCSIVGEDFTQVFYAFVTDHDIARRADVK